MLDDRSGAEQIREQDNKLRLLGETVQFQRPKSNVFLKQYYC